MDKKHLMRLFAVNSAVIEQTHVNMRLHNINARHNFALGATGSGKFWLKEVAKDKAALARLVETQKVIKAELRSGKRSVKKHGPNDQRYYDWAAKQAYGDKAIKYAK